jgi:DnaJ-class molecular chaperone
MKEATQTKDRICPTCKGTKNDNHGQTCIPCRGEGVLTHKDNKRLAMHWQASVIKGMNLK